MKAAAKEKMEIPLLFFGGATTLADAFAPYLRQIARDFRVEVVPSSGHWMPEENPDFLLAKLRSFLSAGRRVAHATA